MTNNPTPPDLSPAELRALAEHAGSVVTDAVIVKAMDAYYASFQCGRDTGIYYQEETRIDAMRAALTAVLPDLVAAREPMNTEAIVCSRHDGMAHFWVADFDVSIGERGAWVTRDPMVLAREAVASEPVASNTVSGDAYVSAVRGRSEFRTAYRDALAKIRRLQEAIEPFVRIVRESSGRIPTEKLSLADWHKLTKAAKNAPQQPPAVDRYRQAVEEADVKFSKSDAYPTVAIYWIKKRAAEIEKEQGHG